MTEEDAKRITGEIWKSEGLHAAMEWGRRWRAIKRGT
jgi:hypothetical protein